MRRLPIYFVIDVSESMVANLPKVDSGLQMIVKELNSDPYALETVYISLIVFAGKCRVIKPLTEVYNLSVPSLPLGGGTDYGEAFNCLMKEIDNNIVKSTPNQKGDWKPIIFFFTDGNPTSTSYNSVFKKWKNQYSTKTSVIAISLAAELDYTILGQITEQIYLLNKMDEETVKSFFKWVSASIQTNSIAVGDNKEYGEEVMVKSNSDILHKINLKKDSKSEIKNLLTDNSECKIIIGKCSKTKKRYINLFIRNETGTYEQEGCYAVPDEESYDQLSNESNNQNDHGGIDTSSLEFRDGCNCPHCNNPLTLSKCGCGKVFCSKKFEGTAKLKCPWCNKTGLYSYGSFSVGTGLG